MATLRPYDKARRDGIRAAQQQHQRMASTMRERVDVFGAIQEERIWLFFNRLGNLFGAYKRDGATAGIVINAQHPLSLQRFTGAHEFGHHVLGHQASADDEDRIYSRSNVLQEVAAQAFAGEFLLPIQLTNYTLKTMGLGGKGVHLSATDVYQFALELGVSYSAAVTQLVGQKKLSISEGRRLRDERPKAIKVELGGDRPKNSWADVWLLDQTQEGRELLPRVRDEIHVTLPETPSTGYVWQIDDAAGEVLELVNDRFDDDDDDEEIVGATGTRHLLFRVTHPGYGQIRLTRGRPWLERAATESVFAATIDAAPPLTGSAEEGLIESQKLAVLEDRAA